MAFEGYTQETLDFLWGIRFNNERSWFLAHKQDYEAHLLAPTRALGEQVYEALHAAFPKEPFLLKLSRIYRDARRLHGNGPYKDHLWFCVRAGGEDCGVLFVKGEMKERLPYDELLPALLRAPAASPSAI